jgi:hypothetical protein
MFRVSPPSPTCRKTPHRNRPAWRHPSCAWVRIKRPVDEAGAQTETPRGHQIAGMRRAHHHFFGLQLQQAGGGEVCFAIGLVMPGQLGGKNQVPGNTSVLGHVGEQRYVAVRQRRDHIPLLQARKTGDGIGPWLQAVPDAVSVVLFFFGKAVDVKLPEQVFEQCAMQMVEVGPGHFTRRTLSMEGA